MSYSHFLSASSSLDCFWATLGKFYIGSFFRLLNLFKCSIISWPEIKLREEVINVADTEINDCPDPSLC